MGLALNFHSKHIAFKTLRRGAVRKKREAHVNESNKIKLRRELVICSHWNHHQGLVSITFPFPFLPEPPPTEISKPSAEIDSEVSERR